MPDLVLWQWLVLLVGAVLIGYAKTAINGVGSIAVVLFAAVLPARESTGTLLPLLIAADLIAIWVYRRHANWALIVRLMPWIPPSLCCCSSCWRPRSGAAGIGWASPARTPP